MKQRKITAIICLSALGLSLISRMVFPKYGDTIWMCVIVALGIVMFVESGNDMNWSMEKAIVRIFKKKGNKKDE